MRLHDTKTREIRALQVGQTGEVGMYVCGPTVYDEIHIGNARPLVVFDVLYRYLQFQSHLGAMGPVKFVRNITDVDDKINNRARELGITIQELTQKTTKLYHIQCHKLHCLPPDVEPKATEHIPQMIDLIQQLLNNGHAYSEQGHVLFDTASWGEYGKFANRSMEDLIHGARVEVAPYKKNPTDFVLWKPAEFGESVGWDSPFGYGRPGWHLECSAMAHQYLGANFAIHGGGMDLIFPHHQNELAQSCCAFDHCQFADIWLHNGFVMVDGEKMSKSLGNFCTVKELTDEWGGQVIRYFLLSTHYRSPLDFQRARLPEIYDIVNRLNLALHQLGEQFAGFAGRDEHILTGKHAVAQTLENDLNTHESLMVINTLWQALNANKTPEQYWQLRGACSILGLDLNPFYDQYKQTIQELLNQRTQAKADKNYALADEIRQKLTQNGVLITDTRNGESAFMVSKPMAG